MHVQCINMWGKIMANDKLPAHHDQYSSIPWRQLVNSKQHQPASNAHFIAMVHIGVVTHDVMDAADTIALSKMVSSNFVGEFRNGWTTDGHGNLTFVNLEHVYWKNSRDVWGYFGASGPQDQLQHLKDELRVECDII